MGGNPPAPATAEAATQAEPRHEADGSASAFNGNPVRADERYALGDAAPGVGIRQRDKPLALSGVSSRNGKNSYAGWLDSSYDARKM